MSKNPKTKQQANNLRYTLPDRLSDVIRLITVLGGDATDFPNEAALVTAIRGNPLSATSWQNIAISHPEFFRPNGNNQNIALLIRSYFPVVNGHRERLTVEQTQKLIDVAISLHEKEIQRHQMNSHRTPIRVAAITLIGVLATAGGVIYNAYKQNESKNSTNQKIEALIKKVDGLTSQPAKELPKPFSKK